MKHSHALVCTAILLIGCSTQPRSEPAPSNSLLSLSDLRGSSVVAPVGLFVNSMDSNRDAIIDEAEFNTGVRESFLAGDLDSDGEISPIEFTAWSIANLGSEYSTPGRLHFDHDQNSAVSSQEFERTLAGIYTRLDRDRSGAIHRSELLVQMNGIGMDPSVMRAEMEAQMRSKMQQLCRRSGRTM